ncbi:hypothetical protein [Rhodococcus qingshengii]|uniref:hypothetical protein n=1 Tax=Rhodococcus qingshengii TaxID=334542 RepID=UPI0035E0491A
MDLGEETERSSLPVTKELPIKEIRNMTYAGLEGWWEDDFGALCSTAVAEATGNVHPSVAEQLRSEDWIEQWADALYASSAELISAAERMMVSDDPRAKSTRKRADLVHKRLMEAEKLIADNKKRQGKEMQPDHDKDAQVAALSILTRKYFDELEEIRQKEFEKRGLPADIPMTGIPFSDGVDSVERCVEAGLINSPMTEEVHWMLNCPIHELTRVVADDVTDQEDRVDELRHPLLIRRWGDCLDHLRDYHCGLLNIDPVFSLNLPYLDMDEMYEMTTGEARKILNRRRFIRALAQRHREYTHHVRQLVRVAALRRDEARAPWFDATFDARQELGRRHQEELDFLMERLSKFCISGTTIFMEDKSISWRKNQEVSFLKKVIQDGTWRDLSPASPR